MSLRLFSCNRERGLQCAAARKCLTLPLELCPCSCLERGLSGGGRSVLVNPRRLNISSRKQVLFFRIRKNGRRLNADPRGRKVDEPPCVAGKRCTYDTLWYAGFVEEGGRLRNRENHFRCFIFQLLWQFWVKIMNKIGFISQCFNVKHNWKRARILVKRLYDVESNSPFVIPYFCLFHNLFWPIELPYLLLDI